MSAQPPRTREPTDPLLSIGTFARQSRLSPRALRLYEREGLLLPAEVDDANGYRYYRHSQLLDARLIASLRRLGMPLRQVADLLGVPGEHAAGLLRSYWDGVERRVDADRQLCRYLQGALVGQDTGSERYRVFERTVPARTLLSEQHHVTITDLAARTQEVAARLMSRADAASARAGEIIYMYHGEVGAESDGPVEICLPVDGDAATKAGLSTRVEPAHREAYTRLVKADSQYPQILAGFDAVFAWVDQQHGTYTGPPRESYFGHYPTAAPDDEICDIALPYQPAVT